MVFEPAITFFKGLVPKGFHFFKWENNFKGIIGEKLGKHLVRQQHGSCVLILFQGLEFLHGTFSSSKGVGMSKPLQKVAMRSLCMLPG